MKENNNFIEQLKINDVVRKVQEELMQAQRAREKEGIPPLFEVDSLELEIHFTVQRSTEAGADVTLAVIDGGLHHNYSSEQIQRITLKLKATDTFQPPVYENGFLPDCEI